MKTPIAKAETPKGWSRVRVGLMPKKGDLIFQCHQVGGWTGWKDFQWDGLPASAISEAVQQGEFIIRRRKR